MRGFFSGTVWGVIVGGLGIAAVSLVNPPSETAEDAVAAPLVADAAPAVVAPEGDGPVIAAPDAEAAAPVTPEAETRPEGEVEPPQVAAPAEDTAPAIAETAPPAPEAPAAPVIAEQPASDPQGEQTPSEDTAAVEAAPAETALPEAETEAEAGTDSEADTAPEVDTVAVAETPEVPAADVSEAPAVEAGNDTAAAENVEVSDAAPVVAEDVTALAEPEIQEAPAAPVAVTEAPTSGDAPTIAPGDATPPEPPQLADTDPAPAPTVAATGTLETPADGTVPARLPGTETTLAAPNAQPDAPDAPDEDKQSLRRDAPVEEPAVTVEVPVQEAAPATDATPPSVSTAQDASPLTPLVPISPAAPSGGDTAPATVTAEAEVAPPSDTPVVSVLPGGDTGVRVNRLTGGEDVTEGPSAEDPALASPEVDPDAPAIERFAAVSDNPDGLPEMAIVLSDDGSFAGAVAALAGLPFPVSVMLNPSSEGVADRMAAYRAAGIEVGLVATLPPAATATDVAVYFEAALGSVPDAIAVLDANGDTQGDADVIQQTMTALADQGQGLITVPRGLNSAPRVAADYGVAAGVIYREIDAAGQDARAIGRFLDQAAFRARQESGVILLGQVRSETITALSQWGRATAGGQVAMVPVSAVLLAE